MYFQRCFIFATKYFSNLLLILHFLSGQNHFTSIFLSFWCLSITSFWERALNFALFSFSNTSLQPCFSFSSVGSLLNCFHSTALCLSFSFVFFQLCFISQPFTWVRNIGSLTLVSLVWSPRKNRGKLMKKSRWRRRSYVMRNRKARPISGNQLMM
jgi:hypothetical protein